MTTPRPFALGDRTRLTEELVIDQCRNPQGAKKCLQSVLFKGPAGSRRDVGCYVVTSEGSSKDARGRPLQYFVELTKDAEECAIPKGFTCSKNVVSCQCMDHLRYGPMCKHAGAAMLYCVRMAEAVQGKPFDTPALSAEPA